MNPNSTMKNIHKSEFAARIKHARETRRISQKQVAEHVGVSRQSLNAWENADIPTMPKGDKLEKLLMFLDVSVNTKLIKPEGDLALQLLGRSLEVLQSELAEHKLEMQSLKAMRENDIARLEHDKKILVHQINELNATIRRLRGDPAHMIV